MTIETKTTIQLSDVTAIEFECKQCHAIMSWPISRFQNPPTVCNCHTNQQWMPHGGEMFAKITDLGSLIRGLGAADKEPFAMRLSLKGLSASAPVSREKG